MRPSVASDLTPQKTPQTTTIGNYQTDWNGRRFRTNEELDRPHPHFKTGVTVLLINTFRVQVPAGAPRKTEHDVFPRRDSGASGAKVLSGSRDLFRICRQSAARTMPMTGQSASQGVPASRVHLDDVERVSET